MCNLARFHHVAIPGVAKLVHLAPAPALALWLVELGKVEIGLHQRCLSAMELSKATRFHDTPNRTNYLAAHIALRLLLANATGIPPEVLVFTQGPFGKPALQAHMPCFFNMGHSNDWALIGISQGERACEIGVDIEVLRPIDDLQELACQVLTPRELTEFNKLQADQQSAAFLRHWTRKEACLKAWGCGLQIDLTQMETMLPMSDSNTATVRSRHGSTLFVHSYQQSNQFVASVAMAMDKK